jgi:hypothetical protein
MSPKRLEEVRKVCESIIENTDIPSVQERARMLVMLLERRAVVEKSSLSEMKLVRRGTIKSYQEISDAARGSRRGISRRAATIKAKSLLKLFDEDGVKAAVFRVSGRPPIDSGSVVTARLEPEVRSRLVRYAREVGVAYTHVVQLAVKRFLDAEGF